jgi:hypothetical protein
MRSYIFAVQGDSYAPRVQVSAGWFLWRTIALHTLKELCGWWRYVVDRQGLKDFSLENDYVFLKVRFAKGNTSVNVTLYKSSSHISLEIAI